MVLPEHSKVLHPLILTLLSATTIELKASYDAKNGAPTTAALKIFFKWFYINTITGEKSCEIMGYANFTE